jgi:hypothetical protein
MGSVQIMAGDIPADGEILQVEFETLSKNLV